MNSDISIFFNWQSKMKKLHMKRYFTRQRHDIPRILLSFAGFNLYYSVYEIIQYSYTTQFFMGNILM